MKMEFREIYCTSCKKVIGRYNIKFYTEDKITEKEMHFIEELNNSSKPLTKDYILKIIGFIRYSYEAPPIITMIGFAPAGG